LFLPKQLTRVPVSERRLPLPKQARLTSVTISNWHWCEDPTAAKLEMALTGVSTSGRNKHCGSRFHSGDCISVGVDRMQRNFVAMRKQAAD